jgi:hypothetical protein
MSNIARELSLKYAVADATEIARILRQPDGKYVYAVKGPSESENADPGVWGRVAVDLLRYAAATLEEAGVATVEGKLSRRDILERMKALFDAEWTTPTTEIKDLA